MRRPGSTRTLPHRTTRRPDLPREAGHCRCSPLWRRRSRSPERSGSGLGHRGQSGAVVSKNTITILPLAGVGGQNAADLAEAVTEDLTIEVSRLPDTVVVAHPAGNAPAGPDSDAPSVGRRLNVDYVLSGSLQRQGEAVSIAVKLQTTAGGTLLWSERFDYGEQAGWNWRRDITARIANQLKVRIDESGTPFDKPYAGRAFAAIDPTLQGWRILKRVYGREEPQRARALFEQALQIDPDSATALSGLALSHITEVLNRSSRDSPQPDRAGRASDRTIAGAATQRSPRQLRAKPGAVDARKNR